jgi:hypothetical protein
MSETSISYHTAQVGRVLLVGFVVVCLLILVVNSPSGDEHQQRIFHSIPIDALLLLVKISQKMGNRVFFLVKKTFWRFP